MRYSRMTVGQRKLLLEDPENYPMRVRFLGKVGILTMEQVAFLRENLVDFDVDDRQVAEILGEAAVRPAATRLEGPPASRAALLLAMVGAIVTAWQSLRRILRL